MPPPGTGVGVNEAICRHGSNRWQQKCPPEARGDVGTRLAPPVDSTGYSELSAFTGAIDQSGFTGCEDRYGFSEYPQARCSYATGRLPPGMVARALGHSAVRDETHCDLAAGQSRDLVAPVDQPQGSAQKKRPARWQVALCFLQASVSERARGPFCSSPTMDSQERRRHRCPEWWPV